MADTEQNQKAWREVRYAQKFLNAFRGVGILARATRHFWIHMVFAVAAVVLGFYFDISGVEWVAIVFAIGLVLALEALNTAIEIDMDLTSPEYHPYARDTKDAAAAAVLLASIAALIVGLIIFLPKIF